MRWIATALVAAACADAPAAGPLEYNVSASRGDPFDREPSATPPVLYINDHPVTRLTMVFDPRTDADGATYVLEQRHGDRVVSHVERSVLDNYALERAPDAPWATTSFCSYDSGDLRFGSESAYGGGLGDGFCRPWCSPLLGGCEPGMRCTSRIVSTAPLASHLGCAPIGAKKLGEVCSLVADPDGDYDDCDAGLLCVEGTCHALCRHVEDRACGGATCSYVEGHAPEVMVCL